MILVMLAQVVKMNLPTESAFLRLSVATAGSKNLELAGSGPQKIENVCCCSSHQWGCIRFLRDLGSTGTRNYIAVEVSEIDRYNKSRLLDWIYRSFRHVHFS